jgi:hypothetical protein
VVKPLPFVGSMLISRMLWQRKEVSGLNKIMQGKRWFIHRRLGSTEYRVGPRHSKVKDLLCNSLCTISSHVGFQASNWNSIVNNGSWILYNLYGHLEVLPFMELIQKTQRRGCEL